MRSRTRRFYLFMKFFVAAFALCFFSLSALAQEFFPLVNFGENSSVKNDAKPVVISVFPDRERVPAAGEFSLYVQIKMERGWHVYWKNPGEAGLPLSIAWKNVPAGASFGKWQWSTPAFYELQGLASFVFENVAWIKIPVKIPANAATGTGVFSGTAEWLACDDNGCWPQRADFSVSVEIVPASEKSEVSAAASPSFASAEKTFPRRDLSVPAKADFAGKNPEITIFVPENLIAENAVKSAKFFPESRKIEANGESISPKSWAKTSDKNWSLRFSFPIEEGEKISSSEELAGVLVFENSGEKQAIEIVPSEAASSVPVATEFSWDAGFLGLLALAFLGGLILNLMPCVFPVLGLKILHFVGKAGSDRKKLASHGFVFAGGVVISFLLLAAVLAVLRNGGEQLGWGFQLQEPGFVYVMTLLLFVFGLSMSGVFEFGVSATTAGGSLAEKSGYAGSFFSGTLAVVVATPCAAPFLAPALGSALAVPLLPSFAIFTAIALGLAFPYVVFSCVPALLKFLPKPGAWMETFKQAMAFLLYAPALYFFWVLAGQISDAAVLRDVAISFSVVALACWIYGKWGCTLWRSRRARLTGTVVALVLFSVAVAHSFLGIYQKNDGGNGSAWVEWSPETQARALDEGKIVFVDFTARWCATCQVNKRVFSDATLQEKFAESGVVKMRADWTNKNPEIATELQKYGRAAVPVNVFLKKGAQPVVLGELFSGPESVLSGLEEIAETPVK